MSAECRRLSADHVGPSCSCQGEACALQIGPVVQTKQAVEFGREVTLYRVVADDGWSTLWHSSEERAWTAYLRHFDQLVTAYVKKTLGWEYDMLEVDQRADRELPGEAPEGPQP